MVCGNSGYLICGAAYMNIHVAVECGNREVIESVALISNNKSKTVPQHTNGSTGAGQDV
jgi:hypothetical protein